MGAVAKAERGVIGVFIISVGDEGWVKGVGVDL
jgi:hypothetical protein